MEMTSVNIEARKQLDLRTGDTVRVHQKIKDKDGKTRIQTFEGMVIARKHGTEAGGTFTVRRVANGYGVEKIYPLYSPMIDSIEITKRSKIRRSKLYYIRETALKQIRKRMKMMFVDIKEDQTLGQEEVVPEAVQEETPATETEANGAENSETANESEKEETVAEEVKTEEVKPQDDAKDSEEVKKEETPETK